MKLTLNKRS